ncbi:type IV secretion system protein [Dyella koreensis]|uniref:Type IV secretion system protein n=1 Tax=Dyella koreensis TaxID=311235 RepID=A0ABW8K2T0_9GAMM
MPPFSTPSSRSGVIAHEWKSARLRRALSLVTLWIMIQGYRMVTSQSRESMMHLVTGMGRVAVIVTASTTMVVSGADLHDWLTISLNKEVHGLFAGNADETTASAIDKNLAYTQIALSTINPGQGRPPAYWERAYQHGYACNWQHESR